MESRSFHFADGKSDKFWTISLDRANHTVHYGRNGTNGQTQTKEFATEAEARASYDKLVREKLKGGYQEQGAAQAIAPVVAKAAVASVTPVPASSQPRPAVPQLRPKKPRREILLDDWDWNLATWRSRRRKLRPPVVPFDQADAVNRALQMLDSSEVWVYSLSTLNISPSMEPREAHFWLEAFASLESFFQALNSRGNSPGSKHTLRAKFQSHLAGLSCREELSEEDARLIVVRGTTSPDLLLPLCALFPVHTAIRLLREAPEPPLRGFVLQSGVCSQRLLPALSDDDLDILRREVRDWLSKAAWPATNYGQPSCVFYLAATLGLHQELGHLVQSWPDDQFPEHWASHYSQPQNILFGLGSAERVQAEFVRLKLSLRTRRHIRGWLAHTELNALEYVRDCIRAVTNKKEAAALTQEFAALVIAPEAAPVFLDLLFGSKAPQAAREWLQSNPVESIHGLLPVLGTRGSASEAALEFLKGRIRAGDGPIVETALSAAPQLERHRAALFSAEDDLPVASDADLPSGLKAAF